LKPVQTGLILFSPVPAGATARFGGDLQDVARSRIPFLVICYRSGDGRRRFVRYMTGLSSSGSGSNARRLSGIVIPDATAEKPEQGEVIAVGSGKLLQDGTQRPLQLKVGDQVR
jgi:hypothetical protein